MASGWVTDDHTCRDMTERALTQRLAIAGLDTRYYNPATHRAAFALPNNVAALVRTDQ